MKPQFENTQAQRISRASRAPSQYGSGRRRCSLRGFFGPEQLVKSIVLGAVLAMAAFAIRANATPDSLLIIGDSISDDGSLAVLSPSSRRLRRTTGMPGFQTVRATRSSSTRGSA